MSHYPHDVSDFTKDVKISKLPLVYVLATPDLEYIKIGQTVNYRQRLINIQSGCPFKLHSLVSLRSPKYKEIELFLHRKFPHANVRGEWFSLNEEDIHELFDFFNKTNAHIREKYRALL